MSQLSVCNQVRYQLRAISEPLQALAATLKTREIDIVIVVNVFQTGFDATALNTIWLYKNLRQHGLIEALSRTNRILNTVKTYGNILCFRD